MNNGAQSNGSSTNRPDSRRTVIVLTAGTLIAVTAFAADALVRFAGQTALADQFGTIAVVALLATPAVALLASASELRRLQPIAATMAVVVLIILAAATTLALLSR